MSLELSQEVENRIIECAASEGISVNDLLARTFASTPPEMSPPIIKDPKAHVQALLAKWQAADNTPFRPAPPMLPGETEMQALFRRWGEEDANMTEEEQEAERCLWQDIEKGVNENNRVLKFRQVR